ncbi:SDR family oxidoreductase [Altererythrobacter arenosus]|uniref:SDR family oxidoreductase n=1 Tax=Altererythrobacter arenosus TaxID=3032592 RepID=A0ABY8FXM4_9SPHN|nr:SDR family oxidoreductase [Altererythrobacter sp. CAU 1644]WFL78006.1 SDR family oxidoreductase [Altererythrobacter sp. CAU 1644]
MAERRSIFITGGGSGIGREVALYFGERGWFVGIADIDEQGMQDTLGLIPGGFKYSHKLDVRDRAAWDVALDAFSVAAGGRIDVVFNNAGIGHGGPLAEQPDKEIVDVLDINLKGVIYGAQASYPHLKKSAPGSVLINTASLAGIVGAPNLSVYCATKWAVRGLTQSLDAEWAKDGIKVAALCPGFIDTPIIEQTRPDSNQTVKDSLIDAGVEVSPVSAVPTVVWNAVHGDKLEYTVGKTASRLRYLQRFLPGRVRKEMRKQGIGAEI